MPTFESLHHRLGLPGSLQIPMESFTRAVEIVLKDTELRDVAGYRPDFALWEMAAAKLRLHSIAPGDQRRADDERRLRTGIVGEIERCRCRF